MEKTDEQGVNYEAYLIKEESADMCDIKLEQPKNITFEPTDQQRKCELISPFLIVYFSK